MESEVTGESGDPETWWRAADRAETLAWVNRWRELNEGDHPRLAELPEGRRKHAMSCPLHRALPWAYGVSPGYINVLPVGARDDVGYVRVPLPGFAERFVRNFDEGLHPDLVEREES